METTSHFTPKHSQPVTLDALLELEPAILTAEISRLDNSIGHLLRSNQDLAEAEMQEEDGVDREVFADARRENEVVMWAFQIDYGHLGGEAT